jgi:hypothetical protein
MRAGRGCDLPAALGLEAGALWVETGARRLSSRSGMYQQKRHPSLRMFSKEDANSDSWRLLGARGAVVVDLR